MISLIAEILDRFSPGAIGWTVLGLIAALSVAVLILTGINQARRLFGRQPSFAEIIKTLCSVEDFEDYKKEQHLRHRGLEEQISGARHDFDERANSDLVNSEKVFKDIFDRSEERDRTITILRDSVSALQERTTTHIRSLDALFQKCDRLLERLPRGGPR